MDEQPTDGSAPEEVEAQQSLERARPADAVRRLLRSERQAVLSTVSVRRQGWPFASLAPYASSRQGELILLLSTLAQHTKNLAADSRACLFVQDRRAAADPQAGARATLLGRVRRAAPEELDDVRARYLARHPQAEGYFAQHDFHLYLHSVDEVRFIFGFGLIGWVPGIAVLEDAEDPLAVHARGVLAHVNGHHAAAVAALCRARGRPGDGARAVGVDRHGFDVDGPAGRLRFEFDAPADTTDEVRARFVELLARARGG
jgi:putative heme iron utilization protein